VTENVKPQEPAAGISYRGNWGDTKSYRVECECSDPAHAHDIWIEADETEVSVIVYTQVKSKFWELNRWKQIWTLLTKGYVEYEAALAMNQQQAINYAEAIRKGVKDVETHINKRIKIGQGR
jgi:hypothetical protein